MKDLVYCTRHASIQTIMKLMQYLEHLAQDLDIADPKTTSPFDQLCVRMHVICSF